MSILASNGTLADVQAKVNAAATGDTVTIPAGSYTWAGLLTINKAITVQAVTINPANPPVPTVTVTHNNGAGDLIDILTSSAGDTVLAGISFQPGTATGVYVNVGSTGPTPGICVMHNCLFEIPNFQLAQGVQWFIVGGLIYQCSFRSSADGAQFGWGSGSGSLVVKQLGTPWYNTSTFGSLDTTGRVNLYIEDSTFYNLYSAAVDVDDCARVNVRYCNIINSTLLTHGITSLWGGRQLDINNNVFEFRVLGANSNGIHAVNVIRWLWMRAGTARVWGNQVDQISSSDWGTHESWWAIDEPLTRPGAGNGGVCETQSQWPGTRWPGTGSNGTQHPNGVVVSPSDRDPLYIWNNTPGPHSNGASTWMTNDQTGYGCDANGPTSAVFLLNRDIFLSAPAGNPSPAYTAFAYPHPVRSGIPLPPDPGPGPGPRPPSPVNMQTAPDLFRPPASFGPYPSFGTTQTSRINTAAPKPPTQTAPDYGDGKGLGVGQPIGSSLAGIEAQKTQFPGPAQAAAAGTPANIVWRVGADGQLHAYDAFTGKILS